MDPESVTQLRLKTVSVCVSSAKPIGVSATTTPYASKGYGPKALLKKAIISAVGAKSAAASSAMSAGK